MTPKIHKTVLVTGCSSGIGKAVAYGLREQGFTVYPTVRKHTDMAALSNAGFEVIQLDYVDKNSVATAFAELMDKTQGQLFAVFHNGAYGQPGGVEDISREVMEKQFASNFFGWHQLTTLILPVMRQQGYGRIIVNSSILGFIAFPMRGAYNASKFALEGLFDTLRLELSGTGIHVSLIEPGPISSDFRKNAKKAFEENLYHRPNIVNASPHQAHYRQVITRLNKQDSVDPFTLPPEAVLKKVVHALNSPCPNIRYPVTVPTQVFSLLKRLLPHRMLDWILRKAAK
jgi:NAD(P)-dependent dehydrogenase (short-subunit alcohol dehydrogenase family)